MTSKPATIIILELDNKEKRIKGKDSDITSNISVATVTKSGGKWSKYPKRYRKEWEKDEELKGWLQPVPGDEKRACCRFCHRTLRAHKNDLLKHSLCPKHRKRASEVKVVTMDPKIADLLELSREAVIKAYCPYSHFSVGAALLCEDGTVFTGCNVENASYGLSMCAERTAIFKAVSEGYKTFKAIAVSSTLKEEYAAPCGACRQVLAEFGTSWDVYITKPDLSFQKWTVAQLLPHSFTPHHLSMAREESSVSEYLENFNPDSDAAEELQNGQTEQDVGNSESAQIVRDG